MALTAPLRLIIWPGSQVTCQASGWPGIGRAVCAVPSLVIRSSVMVRGIGVVLRWGSWFGFQVGFGFAGPAGAGFQEFCQGLGVAAGLPVAELVDHDQVGGPARRPPVFGVWRVVGLAHLGRGLRPGLGGGGSVLVAFPARGGHWPASLSAAGSAPGRSGSGWGRPASSGLS